jgi:hypothetical protein
MLVLWRLRSPFSGQVTECYLIEATRELHIVDLAQDRTTASSRFTTTAGAMTNAAALAGALLADGWTSASVDEEPA